MLQKTVIFALCLAVASCRPQVDLFDCSGKENGPHADLLDDNRYYICLDGSLVVHAACDKGEIFDSKVKTCSDGSDDEDLKYSYESGDDVLDDEQRSEISNIVSKFDDLGSVAPSRPPNRPPNRPPTNPPTKPPTKPSQDPDIIYNLQISKNIFPKSILIIGRANREQKNK